MTTPRGRTSGGIDPLLEVAPSELDSFGVDTLSDPVAALRPSTRSSRSDQMAVVLINGHLAGQTEFDNLPREAIERVEVLPESEALQYGFSENQRVLNFNFNSSIPLTNPDHGVLPTIGELSATFNAALDNVSNFGTLLSTSYGFDYKPQAKVHLDAIYTDHRAAPTLQQLQAPPIDTPNVEMFDYISPTDS